jgi:hypothetical protein
MRTAPTLRDPKMTTLRARAVPTPPGKTMPEPQRVLMV